jgi:hypothetical protein
MNLRFYAKGNKLVRIPGAQPLPKQPDMYVGRFFDRPNRSYPASEQAYEIDSDTKDGQRLARLARLDKCLYPADKETAAHVGLPFVKVQLIDGSYVESVQEAVNPPAKGSNKLTDPKQES